MAQKSKKKNITTQRKQQILDAARIVFSKKGFARATTAEIAQTAGIAEGTIYNYFQSKHDLLISLISSYMLSHASQSLFKYTPASDTISLSSLIEDRLNISFDNIDIQLLLMTEIEHAPAFRENYTDKILQPINSMVKELLESGINTGIFRSPNPEVTTRALIGMIIGLAILYKIEGKTGFLSEIPRGELADEITDLILKGIKAEHT